MNNVICADVLDGLRTVPDKSISIVFTSPPYADRRAGIYDTVSEQEYVSWFLPIAVELKRVLREDGSFFLNIKPHSRNGERSLYVMRLVLAITGFGGFSLKDEFCWLRNTAPGKYKDRFKNGFEPIYHFTQKGAHIFFNPYAVATPLKPQSIARYRRKRSKSGNGSGFTGATYDTEGIDAAILKGALPDNVVNFQQTSNQYTIESKHPAIFPYALPQWFIKAFCPLDGVVLDPFCGSGSTLIAAKLEGRKYLGIDNNPQYVALSVNRLNR